jgi:hypothetical protein
MSLRFIALFLFVCNSPLDTGHLHFLQHVVYITLHQGDGSDTSLEIYRKNQKIRSGEIMVLDDPGASPRRLGAPIAMKPHYLYTEMENFSGQAMQSHRPCAPASQRGLGWRKGGDHI